MLSIRKGLLSVTLRELAEIWKDNEKQCSIILRNAQREEKNRGN